MSAPQIYSAGLLLALAGGAAADLPSPVRLHADQLAGWHTPAAVDAEALFAQVWAALPDEIAVWPTENYVYWQLAADGRDWRGNLRLSPGDREHGRLHFAASEWEEFPGRDHAARLKTAAVFPVLRRGQDDFEWIGTHAGKSVVFRLHQLEQQLPAGFPLRASETFVMRTADESGLRFWLLFDEPARRFRWLLDDTEPVPEHWRELAPGLRQGRRTGFVFHVSGDTPPRLELVAVRAQSVARNDYYDGPFDQLADNYAAASPLQRCLETADPALRGRLDAWGRFTDARRPERVAIAPYRQYHTEDEALRIGRTAATAPD